MTEFLDLGIAGVLAVALFFFLRHLVSQMRQDRMFMEDRLTKIIDNYHEDIKANSETTSKFAGILSELYTWLKDKNGH